MVIRVDYSHTWAALWFTTLHLLGGQAYINIQHEMIVWRREKKGNGEREEGERGIKGKREREYDLLTQQGSPVESVGPMSKR